MDRLLVSFILCGRTDFFFFQMLTWSVKLHDGAPILEVSCARDRFSRSRPSDGVFFK